MNEVTKIHLGRQAFAISAEAHHELRNYLEAIKRRVDDEGVANEVELRMAELLAERGASGEQVILPTDVIFLKEQLGNPKDFADEGESDSVPDDPVTGSKRLFRDTDNAMLAGVAAGLGNYFGIDPLLIRLLFVIATVTGGWGAVIYIVLWLLIPEAKTSSERLQMAGKAITIASLKETVRQTNVTSAARRAGKSLAESINAMFRAVLKIIGVGLVVIGLVLLLMLAGGASYALLHGGTILQDSIFPVGFKEHMLVYVAAGIAAALAVFIVLLGMAIFSRKWPVHAWITGVLVGLTFVGLAVGGGLVADVVPLVRDRYNANLHEVTRNVGPFTQVNLAEIGNDENVRYHTAPTYSVELHYYGNPNLSAVKIGVSRSVLSIRSRQFNEHRICSSLCIPNEYDLSITINSPTPPTNVYPSKLYLRSLPIPPPVLQMR